MIRIFLWEMQYIKYIGNFLTWALGLNWIDLLNSPFKVTYFCREKGILPAVAMSNIKVKQGKRQSESFSYINTILNQWMYDTFEIT